MRDVVWTGSALGDLARIDRRAARRIVRAIERFARFGAGDVKRLQGVVPPQFRLRVGDYRVRFRSGKSEVTILRILNRREEYR